MKLVRKIGKIKRKYGMKIVDRKREKEILSRLEVDAKKFNLPQGFIRNIFMKIIKESRKNEL
jgi:chorismate mutase